MMEFSPPKTGIKVPSGHILIHEKWKGSGLGLQFVKQANGIFSGDMGFVDFYLADSYPVIYVTEADFICGPSYKRKLEKLKDMFGGKGLVVAIRNEGTIDSFNELQQFALIDMDVFVCPVGCHMELPVVLHKMAMNQVKSPNGMKKKPRASASIASQQISLLSLIPGVGSEKANQLLQRFGNITTISESSEDVLGQVVGAATARNIHTFFNKSLQ